MSELKSLGSGTIRAAAFQADLSGYPGVRALHSAVVAELGHPDILFNNSGVTTKTVGPQGNIEDVSVEDFEVTWKTNTASSYLVSIADLEGI